jgi:FkbM family methyltransferase
MIETPADPSTVSRIQSDEARRSVRYPHLPAIFDRFPAAPENNDSVFSVSFLGDRVRHEIDRLFTDPVPKVDEEIFEWMDVLESAESAAARMTVIELGAAYGRWAIRAAYAAHHLDKDYRLNLVEADPRHIGWLKRTLADNGIPGDRVTIHEGVIDNRPGDAVFAVGPPGIGPHDDHWFGQAAVDYDLKGCAWCGDYHGRDLYLAPDGWHLISVPRLSLSAILAEHDRVDLVDMDIQGAEARAVAEAVEPLTDKVRKLHIGTHSQDIEAVLRTVLTSRGWICLRDYSVGRENETPLGRCAFVDGVQTWLNPRLA